MTQTYSDVLNNLQKIQQRQAQIAALSATIETDETGNLIRLLSSDYIHARDALRETNERILEHQFTTDITLKHIVLSEFETDMNEYISFLIQNKNDIRCIDDISELCADFPHLTALFEEDTQ